MTDNAPRLDDASRLEHHLLELFGEVDAGNGTPLAAAVATALLFDADAVGRSAKDVMALDGDVLLDAASALRRCFDRGAQEFGLPFGCKASSLDAGGVTINGMRLLLDADRPGLHASQTVGREAGGSNLTRLQRLLVRKTRKLACRSIGVPSPKTIVDNDVRPLLQFPPLAEAGGVVLQVRGDAPTADRFRSATTSQIERMADEIVKDMQALWKRREEIGRRAVDARLAAQSAVAIECGGGADITVGSVTIDLRLQRGLPDPAIYVEFDCLDEAMRPGTVVNYLPPHREPSAERLSRVLRTHLVRSMRVAELRSFGASGQIDDVAAAIVAAAPEGAVPVLKKLAGQNDTLVILPTSKGTLYATLYWRDGVIHVEADRGTTINYCRDRLVLGGIELPETILDTVVGRPLSEIVELPFDCDCRVIEARVREGTIAFDLEVNTSFVDCAEGRIWPEPAGGFRGGDRSMQPAERSQR